MSKRVSEKPRRSNRTKFILCPIAFFIVGLVLVLIAFMPMLTPMVDVLDLVTLSSPPTFEESAPVEKDFTSGETSGVLNWESLDLPGEGELYGELIIQSAGIDVDLYFGDSPTELRKGVGTYTGAGLPGEGRTMLMAAHNNTYFHTLGDAKPGDLIEINTNYGKYVYEMTDSRVAEDTDSTAYDLSAPEENLILYTCYPFDRLGFTSQRYFVYAKYVSGPQWNLPE